MNIKPRAQKPNRCPAKQVNKALGPQAMLSAEGAAFLRVNRSTPSWLTSSPCVPHPFGDHPRLSLYARTIGSLVLTRVLGGRVRLVDTGPVLDLCTCQLCSLGPRPGPLLSLPVFTYVLPQSQDSGLLQDPSRAHVPGFFLRRAASLGYQVQSVSGNRKNKRQWPSELLARDGPVPETTCTQGWGLMQ